MTDISDRTGFIQLLQRLSRELQSGELRAKNQNTWEFLDGAAGWVHDMDGYYRNRGESTPEPSWKLFADIIRAGLVYE